MREINGILEHVDGSPAKFTTIYFSLVDTAGSVTSSFIASSHERVYGTRSVRTDENGHFSISLVENTTLIDETYYYINTDISSISAFTAGLEEGATALDWLEFKAYGEPITPADLEFVHDAYDSSLDAGSWANEDEDVPVKEYSEDSGTDRVPTVYSAKHYAAKTEADATSAANSASMATTQAGIATSKATEALTSADAAAADALQTAADKVQTGLDAAATSADATQTAADRAVIEFIADGIELNEVYNIRLIGVQNVNNS